jgi:hypothetical protein
MPPTNQQPKINQPNKSKEHMKNSHKQTHSAKHETLIITLETRVGLNI